MAEIIEKINGLPDDAEGVVSYAVDYVTKDVDGNLEANTLCAVADLKALATELSSLRAEVEGYELMLGDDIRRVRGRDWELHPADDGWWIEHPIGSDLTGPYPTAVEAFTALQQQEDKQDGRG